MTLAKTGTEVLTEEEMNELIALKEQDGMELQCYVM